MKRLLYLLSACLMTFGFSACNDDDDNLKLQDISVEFAVSEAGMDGETVSLGLKLSRATTESLDVTMEMTSSDVSDADITTTPAMTDGKITVNIPAGQSTGTFTVAKATGKNPEERRNSDSLPLADRRLQDRHDQGDDPLVHSDRLHGRHDDARRESR